LSAERELTAGRLSAIGSNGGFEETAVEICRAAS
jgi:hypothetical protein